MKIHFQDDMLKDNQPISPLTMSTTYQCYKQRSIFSEFT